MALSNWDTFAVDLDGKPTDGTFASPGGVIVELYKNWIYIHDPAISKKAKNGFMHPVVMELEHGTLRYRDVSIVAIRGPQSGIFVAAWHVEYGGTDKKPTSKTTGMVGCGVSGYSGNRWVGVTKKSMRFLAGWVSKKETSYNAAEATAAAEGICGYMKFEGAPRAKIAAAVRKARVAFLEKRYVLPEEVAKVRLDKGIRFNQGNLYFARRAGTPLQASKPGKAKKTMFSQILGAKKKR